MEAIIYHGTLPLLLDHDEADGPAGMLDSATLQLRVAMPDWRGSLAAMGIVKSQLLPAAFGYESMWVSDLKLTDRSDLSANVEVRCLGLLRSGDDKRKVNRSEQVAWVTLQNSRPQQAEDDTRPLAGANMAIPKWALSWTYFATSRPAEGVVGTFVQLPRGEGGARVLAALELPLFSGVSRQNLSAVQDIASLTDRFMLESREVERLFGGGASGLWAVRETISYVQPYSYA